ncbi:MAG: TIGR04283 family arsenosugar biosynthesis glycosyltransferase [Verrucomicrobia bacterium]|nr:TIGR04283 family arsenosugar biosynthesis glycosyltransferase [Deltaproteobacteria bacterium]
MITTPPELSIIVPVLNDAAELRGLLASLAEQDGVSFEVILCDGGSTDEIQDLAAEWIRHRCFALRVIETARGRGIQMNAGAAAAAGSTLLFLHADSRFTRNDALLSGIQAYKSYQHGASALCAARFRLRFRRSDTSPSLAYCYHEAKARLNRGSCIRGDQGYLIDRTTFGQLGRFDCSLPFLEDVRLAALLAVEGQWLLLPVDISTSARRFEQEGFYERQVANVIIINAVETGWNELLAALPGLCRCDSTSGRLSLFPFLDGVRILINSHDRKWRSSFWRATGGHVAANAWQIFFWRDVRRAFRSGQGADEVKPYWLNLYEHRLKPMFESRPAARLAALLTRVWFWLMLNTTTKKSPL